MALSLVAGWQQAQALPGRFVPAASRRRSARLSLV